MLAKIFFPPQIIIASETEKEITQIQQTIEFFHKFAKNDYFDQYPVRLKNNLRKLTSTLESYFKAINASQKDQSNLRGKIKMCRNVIDAIFICLDMQEKLKEINGFMFNSLQNNPEQKEEALIKLLTAKYRNEIQETLKQDIEKNHLTIFELVDNLLNGSKSEELDSDLIPQKMIEYISQNLNGQNDEVHLALWESFKFELEKGINASLEKILNFQVNILDYLNKSKNNSSIIQDEINHWFTQFVTDSKTNLSCGKDDKRIEFFAKAWLHLLATNKDKAFIILKSMIGTIGNNQNNNPIKNLDDLAFFLFKISNQLALQDEQEINAIAIKKLGYKIYDLISAHFALEKRLEKHPLRRENCIVLGIISSLIANTEFEKYIISGIKPIIDLLYHKRVTFTKGAHLYLKSSSGIPKIDNLNSFALKIMYSEPKPSDFSGFDLFDRKDKGNIFVLVQPQKNAPPIAIYFVDRRGRTSLINQLDFLPNRTISTLTEVLFPAVNDNEYFDKDKLEENEIYNITEQTTFYLNDLSALIKIKNKNEFYLHAALESGIFEVHKLEENNESLTSCLQSINSDFNFYYSEKIWISPQDHGPLYEAIVAMKGGEILMREYNYRGNIGCLTEAFNESIPLLLYIKNYPPELQRILYDFSNTNHDGFLRYLLTRFIIPAIEKYAKDDKVLEFWCKEIIISAISTLTTNKEQRSFYNNRINRDLLDFIYSDTLRSEIMKLCGFTSEIDVNLLNFQIRFIKPLMQLATDAGVANKLRDKNSTQPFNYQISQFPNLLTSLKRLLEEGNEEQINKDETLSKLEEDERDFLILCHCFRNQFNRELNLEELISDSGNAFNTEIQTQFYPILLSALTKLEQIEIDTSEEQARIENIRGRKEFSAYNNLPPEEQLKYFVQNTCLKIWNTTWGSLDKALTSKPSQVADIHFKRLEILKNDFEKFRNVSTLNEKGILRSQNSSQTNSFIKISFSHK